MIAALFAAFQLAVAAPASAAPTVLVVKDATRSTRIALVATAGGPLLRAEHLKPIVPITVSRLTGARWLLIVNGTAVEVEEGIRFARLDGQTYQLATAPEVRQKALFIPLQLVAEIIPRVATNLMWDPEYFELRAFSAVGKFAARGDDAPPETRTTPAPRRSGPPPDDRLADRAPATRAPATSSLRSRRLVMVDAGHGGPDGGMRGVLRGGAEVREKDITLNVAKRVGAALTERGIDVKYTRTKDTLIALSDRGHRANEARADLFVSIHVNAANPGWKDARGARGFETYFLAEAKTEDARRLEQMENEAVRFESGPSAGRGDPLSFILNDMAQNEHLREANELAELIQGRMARVHPGSNRGVKQAGFRVLVAAFMPAVLVEVGFGTNPDEAAYLTDAARMNELSGAIADGVLEYLKRYERRVTASAGAPAGGAGRR